MLHRLTPSYKIEVLLSISPKDFILDFQMFHTIFEARDRGLQLLYVFLEHFSCILRRHSSLLDDLALLYLPLSKDPLGLPVLCSPPLLHVSELFPLTVAASTHLDTVHHCVAASLYSVPGPAHHTGDVCFTVGIA
jgi:hypothetical protein